MPSNGQPGQEALLDELAALRKQCALLAEAEALSGSGSWQWDIAGDTARFSESWLTLHGIKEGSPTIEDMLSLIHSEDRLSVMGALRDALDDENPFNIEYRVNCPDGRTRTMHGRGLVLRDELGLATAFHGTVRDVTDKALAFAEMREANAFLEKVIETTKTLVVCLGPDGNILIGNKAVENVSGYSRAELLGACWFDTLVPRDRFPQVPGVFEKIMRGEDYPEVFENPIVARNGELRYISWRNNRFCGPDGECFLVSFGQEITDQVKAQEALRESREQAALLSDFLENSSQPFVAIGADWRIALCNSSFASLLGYSREELAGMDWFGRITPPDMTQEEREQMARLDAEGRPVRYEKEFIRKDGSRVPVEMSVHLKNHPSGGVAYRYAFMMDMTESKASRERLKAALAAVEASSKAKSEFLANMSHEIRTPISAILGLAELSLRMPEPESIKQHLGMISESAETLLAIIGDVLDLSRVEAGKLELELKPFFLSEVIDNSLAPFRAACDSKGLKLRARLEPGVPDELVGDPVRLGQVLTNLLGNALKFTHKGGISLRVSPLAAISSCLSSLRFTVKDTGIGIDSAHTATIFESFRQADSSYSKSYQGAGLGLAICRELTSLMGGKIWVESEPGKGSSFHFTAVFEKGAAPCLEQKLCQLNETSGVPSRILVAEDNPFNRHVFEQYLKILGHEVTTAADGKDALEVLKTQDFDLVFMDVQMPRMDGLEAVKRIREGECGLAVSNLPVVALTAYAMQGDRERFLEAGMTDYLSKPVTLEALQEAVVRYASSGGYGRAADEAFQEPLRPLLQDYIDFVREKAVQAGKLLESGDLAGAARIGHDIKGTSLAFGVEDVNQAGAEFDMSCRRGDKAQASSFLDEIHKSLAALDVASRRRA